jgi:hypothetical protein
MKLIDLQTSLSPLQLRFLLQAAGRTDLRGKLDQVDLSPGELLLIGLADWLAIRNPVPAEQQRLLASYYASNVLRAAAQIEEAISSPNRHVKLPTIQLAIIDSALATMSGDKQCLDLRTGDIAPGPPTLPMDVYSVNLTSMYVLRRRQATEAK